MEVLKKMNDKKTVVLIVPKTGPVLVSPPFGMMYLASFLRKEGFVPLIVDARIEDFKVRIKNILEEENVVAFGLTCMTGPQITHSLTIAKYLKKLSNIPVVIGGIHPSYLPEETIRETVFDYLITGYGEKILPRLLKAVLAGESLADIPALAYRENGKCIVNESDDVLPDKSFLNYAWDLINLKAYVQYRFIGEKTYSLFTSRGCPFKCSFCYGTSFHRNVWQGQKAELVLSELDYIVEKTGIDAVFFNDDNFVVDKKRVRDIALGLKERGIKYGLCLRADSVDEEFLAFLKDTGCCRIDWGAESGSDEVLKAMEKGICAEDSIRLAKLTAKYDMPAYATFLLGYPGETTEMMYETLKFINTLREINPKIIISDIKIATPYPGSALLKQAVELGYKAPQSFKGWGQHYWNNASLPWIDSSSFVEDVSMSSLFAFCSWRIKNKNPLYNLAVEIMHKIQLARFKNCNFKFPIELRIAKKIIDAINYKLKFS